MVCELYLDCFVVKKINVNVRIPITGNATITEQNQKHIGDWGDGSTGQVSTMHSWVSLHTQHAHKKMCSGPALSPGTVKAEAEGPLGPPGQPVWPYC